MLINDLFHSMNRSYRLALLKSPQYRVRICQCLTSLLFFFSLGRSIQRNLVFCYYHCNVFVLFYMFFTQINRIHCHKQLNTAFY